MKKALNEMRVGIVGGGQLGRMMILEGKKMGLHFTILDPDPCCPASSIADEQVICGFHEPAGYRTLAELSDVVTYELEHINSDILIELVGQGHIMAPSPHILKTIQDKYLQKSFLLDKGINLPDFEPIDTLDALQHVAEKRFNYPFLLKSRRGGYDGKGNYLVRKRDEIPRAFANLQSGRDSLLIEKYIPFQMEVSALVARTGNGEVKVYPLVENIHQENILRITIVPARVSFSVSEKALELARRTTDVIGGTGVFCIEMFVTSDGEVQVNEVAPRTHNSGHYTIEACATSQFNQHLRAILGLPLGSTELLKPAVMMNLLGEERYRGRGKIVGIEEALRISEVYIHYYGKAETRPNRKMGHLTALGVGVGEAMEKAGMARKMVTIIGEER